MGLLDKETRKAIAKRLDSQINAGLLEPIDGLAFNAILQVLDDRFSHLIPEDLQDEVKEVLEAYADGDRLELKQSIADLIGELAAKAAGGLVDEIFVVASTGQGPKEEDPDD